MSKNTQDRTAGCTVMGNQAGRLLTVIGNRIEAPWVEWPIMLLPPVSGAAIGGEGGDVIGGEGGDVIGEEGT